MVGIVFAFEGATAVCSEIMDMEQTYKEQMENRLHTR